MLFQEVWPVRRALVFGECTHMLAVCLGLAFWSIWCSTDLTLGTWHQGRLLRGGTHLHACFNGTFREVWRWPIFLCLPPSKKYPVREAHGACEDGPWSFSCLWDVACFVFSAWLFFPPHPLVLKPPSFKHQHKCHKAFYSLIDHRATINLLPSCSPFISIFGSPCLCMGTCFPNLTFWCSL